MSAKVVLIYIIQLMILSPTASLTPSLNQYIYSSQFKSEELSSSVSVGVIIPYDHVHPVGAFAIKATIDVSVCVRACVCVSVSVMMSLSLSLS